MLKGIKDVFKVVKENNLTYEPFNFFLTLAILVHVKAV